MAAGHRRVAVLDADAPRSFPHNQLLLDDVVPAAIVADARRVLGGAGLPHMAASLLHPDSAAGAAALADLGWWVQPSVTMARRWGPPQPAHRPASAVTRVEAERLRTWWAVQTHRSMPGAPADDVVTQLTDRRVAAGAVADMRYLAVELDGEVRAAAAALDGATAFLDSVDTDQAHRGAGYGEALLLGCLATAERTGCDLVVLDALVDERPRDWYARRGDTEVGRHWMATLLAAPSDVG